MSSRSSLIVPCSLIVVGTGWLLTSLQIAPGIDWIWTLGLALVGVLSFTLRGWDKVTAVVGPFFLTMSCLSVARQGGLLRLDVEVPLLVILAGLLMLVVRHPAIPAPAWFHEPAPPSRRPHLDSGSDA